MKMSDLLVRGVDDSIVQALKKRAGAHGRTLAELLATMPDVGSDADFQRACETDDEAADVFVDTNVISEARKASRADPGVLAGPMRAWTLYASDMKTGVLGINC